MQGEEEGNEWPSLLSGTLPRERIGPLLRESASALHELMRSVPRIEARVGEILAIRLNQGVTVDTWTPLHNSLTQYLGDAAFLLYWVVGVGPVEEDEDRLAEISRHASEEVVTLLRTISVIYGPDLIQAFMAGNEDPDNWQNLERNMYLDMVTGDIRISAKITKYNGEEFTIAGPPDMVLNLASAMMDLAAMVPTEAFSSLVVDRFLEQATALAAEIAPGAAEDDS